MTSLLSIQHVAPHTSTSTNERIETVYDYQNRPMIVVYGNDRGTTGVVPNVTAGKPRAPVNNNRLAYVNALVDANALVIESIWQPRSNQDSVVPLRTFIQEVLKRSRTTYSTLQTALFYIFRSRPEFEAYLFRMQNTKSTGWEDAYVSCGRRMFLASLVVASKFVQDKTYRNSAWAKIAGLPVSEVNAAERIFLNMIQHRLYIHQSTFERWHHLLHKHVEAKTLNKPTHLLDISSLPFAATSPPYEPFQMETALPSPRTPRSYTNPGLTLVLSPSVFLPPPVCDCQNQRKRKRNSCSHYYQQPPVLSMSVPSSINSSPMQTPTQISPIKMNNGPSAFNWNSPTSFDQRNNATKKRKTSILDTQYRSYNNISHVRQQSKIYHS